MGCKALTQSNNEAVMNFVYVSCRWTCALRWSFCNRPRASYSGMSISRLQQRHSSRHWPSSSLTRSVTIAVAAFCLSLSAATLMDWNCLYPWSYLISSNVILSELSAWVHGELTVSCGCDKSEQIENVLIGLSHGELGYFVTQLCITCILLSNNFKLL